jgi:hypothetical protein
MILDFNDICTYFYFFDLMLKALDLNRVYGTTTNV